MPLGTPGVVSASAPAVETDPARRLAQATGYIAESMTYNGATVSTIGVSGTIYAVPIFLRAGDIVSNVTFLAAVAAGSLTLGKVALYDLAGNILASSASAHVAWNGTAGRITTALSSSYTSPRDQFVYAAILSVGTTPATTRMTATGTVGLQPPTNGMWPFCCMVGQADLVTLVPAANTSQAIWIAVN